MDPLGAIDRWDLTQPQIIAKSQSMQDLFRFVAKVATCGAAAILIEGENGTGKDVIAKMLHYQSRRQSEPFLAINCASIPETLLESELFGHEKGAFTDARTQKPGLFELADKGTLLLDEIGEMPRSLQAKLLRVLEDQTFHRLGGLRDIKVDVRIISATNRNLLDAMKDGNFRRDLYYRLSVIRIFVPPLRERPQDILPLTRSFIAHYNARFQRQINGISPDAENLILTYEWPGNVRELRNAIECAMILEETEYIRSTSLQISIGGRESLLETPIAGSWLTSDNMSLHDQERRLIVQALEKTGGNQTHAARLLKITRDCLRYKMRKFKLH
jgi:two-component system response regulator AtoC